MLTTAAWILTHGTEDNTIFCGTILILTGLWRNPSKAQEFKIKAPDGVPWEWHYFLLFGIFFCLLKSFELPKNAPADLLHGWQLDGFQRPCRLLQRTDSLLFPKILWYLFLLQQKEEHAIKFPYFPLNVTTSVCTCLFQVHWTLGVLTRQTWRQKNFLRNIS